MIEQIITLLEKYNYLLLSFKTKFFSLNLCSKFFFPEPESVATWSRSRSKLDRLHNTDSKKKKYIAGIQELGIKDTLYLDPDPVLNFVPNLDSKFVPVP